jgi:hypothetical protein
MCCGKHVIYVQRSGSFNQDLSSWNINLVTDMAKHISNEFQQIITTKILIAWDAAGMLLKFRISPSTRCAGETARTNSSNKG